MFALCADASGGVGPHDLEAMAGVLRGGSGKPAIWCDTQGRAGFAAGTTGILPEDIFDRQPLVSPGVAFAARARIDNRDEILGKLDMPAARWPALADSEVLFLAYQRWGEECVQHLHGDFAFAAWHRDSGKVVAAVDHIGAARLYYSQPGGRLLVSTQLGALLAHPRASRDLDLKALGLLVAPKIEQGSTPFKNVRALTGGHLLIRSEGTLSIRRWWQPDTTICTRYRDPERLCPGRTGIASNEPCGPACELLDGVAVDDERRTGFDPGCGNRRAATQGIGRCITAYLVGPRARARLRRPRRLGRGRLALCTRVAQMHDNLKLVKITPAGPCTLDVVSGDPRGLANACEKRRESSLVSQNLFGSEGHRRSGDADGRKRQRNNQLDRQGSAARSVAGK